MCNNLCIMMYVDLLIDSWVIWIICCWFVSDQLYQEEQQLASTGLEMTRKKGQYRQAFIRVEKLREQLSATEKIVKHNQEQVVVLNKKVLASWFHRVVNLTCSVLFGNQKVTKPSFYLAVSYLGGSNSSLASLLDSFYYLPCDASLPYCLSSPWASAAWRFFLF